MKLSELIENLDIVEVLNFSDVDICSVTQNSKKCNSASLFVAIKGSHLDGADFIPEALSKGVRAIVTERRLNINLKNTIIVKNARKALAELCAKMSGNPERKLFFTGITGTKGKTSTAYILSEILNFSGEKNLLIGTLGVKGISYKNFRNTTPDPTVLFPIFKKAFHSGIKNVSLEVSSQALKDYRVHGIPFDCAAFTGISRDHIGISEHPNFADYLISKRKLFTSFGAKRAVVNFDDAHSSYVSENVAKTVKCGFSHGSDYRITDFSNTPFGSEFCISKIKIRTSLPGEYNARNITMAIAIAKEMYGFDIKEISGAVEKIVIPGRFERQVVNGRNVIIDYAHNGISFAEVMSLSRKLYPGKIISVFGSVGERSFERRQEIANAAEKYSDLSVITSDNPGYESAISICDEILGYFSDKSKAKILVDRSEAIKYAIENSSVGDTVLILGKGRENTMKINGSYLEYSDFDVVRQLGAI